MNELYKVASRQTDISTWDFDRLKSSLEETLAVYKSFVYTDETINAAKDDKTTLNKAKRLIEDRRKEYKKQCLAPYEAIEPQVKELVSMIEEQRLAIDRAVKDYTERQKKEKEKAVRAYYDRKAAALGPLAGKLYDKIFDSRWLNASTSKKKYEEEVQAAINGAVKDIQEIKAMESPFTDTLIETYISTGSVETVKAKNEELQKAYEKAGLIEQPVVQAAPGVEPAPVNGDAAQGAVADEANGTLMRIYAPQSQLDMITDFMNAIGVRFEVLKDV